MQIKTIYSILFLIVIHGALKAQDQPSGEIEDVQVIIEKDKPLTLPAASRAYERTQLKRIPDDSTSLTYTLSQPQFNFSPYSPSFQPRAFKEESGSILKNYVKAGYGNYQSPLLETYIGLEERLNHVGLWAQHESFGKGSVRGNESSFSSNQFIIDGRYVARFFEFEPVLNYRREGFNYYGYDYTAYQLAPKNSDVFLQSRSLFNTWSAGGIIKTISKKDLSASFSPTYQGTTMGLKGGSVFNSDNILRLTSHVDYKINEEINIDAEMGLNWAQYSGGQTDFTRSIGFFSPAVKISRDAFDLKIGAKLMVGKDSSQQFYVYPDISARYNLNDQITLLARIDGDLELGTLQTLYDRNRYMDDSLSIINTNRAFSFLGGINLKLNPHFIVEASAEYSVIKNQALFKYSESDSSRFRVTYDRDFGKFDLNVSGTYLIENQSFIKAQLNYYVYNEGTESEAWFLPLRRFQITAGHQFFKNLNAQMSFSSLGGIKAPYTDLENNPTQTDQYKIQDPIFDLGLGVNYSIKDNIEVFAKADNVLNQQYERYLNYPARGISAKFGFIFRF